MLDRRRFLQFSTLLAAPALSSTASAEATPPQSASKLDGQSTSPILLSASWGDDAMVVGALNGAPAIALPGRGHGILPLPHGEAIVVSRRLGSWLAKINWQRSEIVQMIDAEFDRHFFGHAILSPDAKTLITTENNDGSCQGMLGVYDVGSLKRLAELPSWGIGPHELIWLVPGKILAVANGGVLTLPETGRAKINRGQMNPALVLIEWPSGKKLAEYVLADKALSIRHLARAADGTIGIAMQAEYASAAKHADSPLLALLKPNADQLQLASQPSGLQGYGASIAMVNDGQGGQQFLVSALRGNQLARWQIDGTPLTSLPLPRPAGIVSDGKQTWVSSESGALSEYLPQQKILKELHGYTPRVWDNHLVLALA